MLNLKWLLSVSLVAAFIVSCSGGGSGGGASSSDNYGSIINAQFIDAPVKGLSYALDGGVSSKTIDSGNFTCKSGEKVSFKIKDYDLGFAACGEKIFVQDLISNDPNHTWQKAAAVIQSFSVDDNGILDLSNLDESLLNLSSLSYSSGNFDTNLSTVFNSNNLALPLGATVKSLAQSVVHANDSLLSHISLSTDYKDALDSVLGHVILFQGNLVARNPMEASVCWEKFKAKTSVTKNSISSNDYYTFKTDSAIAYNTDAIEHGDICSAPQELAGKCESFESNKLPQPKIITGLNTNMIYSFEEYNSPFDGNSYVQNVLSLNVHLSGADVDRITGVFEAKTTMLDGPYNGQSIVCRYNVTAQ